LKAAFFVQEMKWYITYGDFWVKASNFALTTLFGEHKVIAGKSISQTGWFVESNVVRVG